MLPHPSKDLDADETTINILELALKKLAYGPLERILQSCNVEYSKEGGIHSLKKSIKSHIRELKKGEQAANYQEQLTHAHQEQEIHMENICHQCLQIVPQHFKYKNVKMFRNLTSKDPLPLFTCTSCAEECLNSEQLVV